MTQEEQMRLAAKLMKLSVEQVQEYGGTIPGSGAYYLSVPQRGGGSLIVALDGTVLYAGSAIGFDEHYRKFQNGERTDLSFFDEPNEEKKICFGDVTK